jgi:hypothetical protein
MVSGCHKRSSQRKFTITIDIFRGGLPLHPRPPIRRPLTKLPFLPHGRRKTAKARTAPALAASRRQPKKA